MLQNKTSINSRKKIYDKNFAGGLISEKFNYLSLARITKLSLALYEKLISVGMHIILQSLVLVSKIAQFKSYAAEPKCPCLTKINCPYAPFVKRSRTIVFSKITNFSCINSSNRALKSSMDAIHTPDSSSKQSKVHFSYYMGIQCIHKFLLDE